MSQTLRRRADPKRKLIISVILAVICGVAFGLDYWIFGSHIPEAAEACRNVTFSSVIASVLYGGVIEEVMLRLFVMSLLSFVLWKIFYRTVPKAKIPVRIFAVANVIAALLFAAGHLPATFLTFQTVDALQYGFKVGKISMKEQTVDFEKVKEE